MALRTEDIAGGVRVYIRAKPRSSRSTIVGIAGDGALEVALKAPPVDGAANAELVKVLAKALGVRKSALRLRSGQSGRNKCVEITGLDGTTLRQRLAPL